MTPPKSPYAQAEKIGLELLNKWNALGMLDAGMIGGSVRRNVSMIGRLRLIIRPATGDIETFPEQPSLLDPNPPIIKDANLFEEYLPEFLESHINIVLGKKKKPKTKALEYTTEEGDILKVFVHIVPDPRAWGVQVMIRTGPGEEFSKLIMTWLREIRMHTNNGLLHGHPKFGKGQGKNRGQCKNDYCKLIIPCYTEEDFFRAVDLAYIAPEMRDYQPLIREIANRKRRRKHA